MNRMSMIEQARPYLNAVLVCALMILVSSALLPWMSIANIGLLFLLVVVLVAVRYGRGVAVFAAVLAGLGYNYFFILPPLGFALSDRQYLVTFAAMLVVGAMAGHVTAGLRYQAANAARREQRAQVLSEFARGMSAAVDARQVVDQAQRVLGALVDGRVLVMLPAAQGGLEASEAVDETDLEIARWVFAHDEPAGYTTAHMPEARLYCIPLRAASGVCGVLAVWPHNPRRALKSGLPSELEAFARLVAIAVERIHFMDVAQEMRLRAASENLRNSMLASMSHDLRTPLAGLIGLVDALSLDASPLSDARRAIVDDIRDSARHMGRLVNNLLDMARIQSGDIRLRREWNSVEEIIGSALRLLRSETGRHVVRVEIPPAFPLVECDGLLIERVIANLVENAVKYSAAGSEILVTAYVDGADVVVSVADRGCGLPENFDPFVKFLRGNTGTLIPGVGLGLAICRAFMEAHGGTIHAGNGQQRGAVFAIRLPAGTPPDAGEDTDPPAATHLFAG